MPHRFIGSISKQTLDVRCEKRFIDEVKGEITFPVNAPARSYFSFFFFANHNLGYFQTAMRRDHVIPNYY